MELGLNGKVAAVTGDDVWKADLELKLFGAIHFSRLTADGRVGQLL